MKPPVPDQLTLFAEPVRAAVMAVRPVVLCEPPTSRPGPKRIDWFRVITIVLRSGYSIQALADEIGVARTTLIGWRQGAEPRYSEGERLVLLWCQKTGQGRESMPMCSTSDWWAYHAKP